MRLISSSDVMNVHIYADVARLNVSILLDFNLSAFGLQYKSAI